MLCKAVLGLFASLLLAGPVFAQDDWPSRPVRIIVPFGPGGSADALARLVAEHLTGSLKQQFIVENRTGAGGAIGAQALATAAPDGLTLGITNVSTLVLGPTISKATAYRPMQDFSHIAYVAGVPLVLAANPKTGVRDLAGFVRYSNEHSFGYVTPGVGTDSHLIGLAMAQATKVKPTHVPYKVSSQALSDVVAGHVPFATYSLSSSAPFLRGGTLVAIAVTSAERMPDYPDLPTFKELGHPDVTFTTWFSLSGPPGLPKAIVDKVNREVNAAMAKPEVAARMRRDGLLVQPMSAAEFHDFIGDEITKWRPLIEAAGLVGTGG